MSDKFIVITGASSGVGKSLVEFFSKQMNVVAIARRLDKLDKNFGHLPNVSCYKCDVSNPEDIRRTFSEIKTKHGFIGYLINNAGIMKQGLFTELSQDDFEVSLGVNLMAPIMAMQQVLPEMVEQNFGRIINVTSGAPLNNFERSAAYSGSKGALNSVTITAAKELAEKNIKINLMSPGAVRSEMAPHMDVDPSICHPTANYLINLDANGETGEFFWLGHRVPMFSDLTDTDWLGGKAGRNMVKIL